MAKILVSAILDLPNATAETLEMQGVANRLARRLTAPDAAVEQLQASAWDPADAEVTETAVAEPNLDPLPSGAQPETLKLIDDPTDDAGGTPGPRA